MVVVWTLYTERAEMAAVSRGTGHVTTKTAQYIEPKVV